MVHVHERNKCDDASQTQKKQSWYHTTMHTRLFRHVYLHTDFNGIGKCAWHTLRYAHCEDGCDFSQPKTHLPDMHRPPFPTTTTKKLAWCWSSPVSVERDEQHEATFMLFILRTPSQPFDKFVFNQRRLPNTPAPPRPFILSSPSVHHFSCFYCYVWSVTNEDSETHNRLTVCLSFRLMALELLYIYRLHKDRSLIKETVFF